MDKAMKIAILLTAVDGMSSVVERSVSKSMDAFRKMEAGARAALSFETGKKGFNAINETVKASADLEEATNKLKAVMMGSDGLYSENMLSKIQTQSQLWSEKYANNATAYIDMVRTMKANRITEEEILGGSGEAAAKLADYFDRMNPAAIGKFIAIMRNDFSIKGAKDTENMADFLARMHDAGVGLTGADSVEQMTQFFGKASLGLANLKQQGLQASKELGMAGGYFLSRGLEAGTVGTNFRRIMDTIRRPEELAAIQQTAAKFGVSLQIFKDGNFVGWANFIKELGKLKGLDTQKIAQIAKPFGGKMGLGTDFIEFLAKEGTDKFSEFENDIKRQATLTQKLDVVMDGLNYATDVFKTSWENVKAQLGSGLIPLFKDIFHWLNAIAVGIRNWTKEHNTITKTIMYIGLFVSALFLLNGAVLTVKLSWAFLKVGLESWRVVLFPLISFLQKLALTIWYELLPAMWSWAAANLAATWEFALIALIIAAVIAGIVLLVYYWDEVKSGMYGVMNAIWPLQTAFLNLGKIMLGAMTFDPKMIIEGIKGINATIDIYKNNSIKDLYWEGYNGSMARIAAEKATAETKPVAPISAAQQVQNMLGFGNSPFGNFTPTINLYGGATQEQANMVSTSLRDQFDKMWKERQHQIGRTGFR